jgi:hypothetical protein
MARRALIAALFCPAAALAADLEPGNWELSLVTMMSGQAKPASATQTRCLTGADARDPSRVLAGGGTCEFSNRNDTGGVFTFDISCTGPLPMKGKGRVEYTAQTMDADLDLTAGDGGGFGMRSFVKGRRLGPC